MLATRGVTKLRAKVTRRKSTVCRLITNKITPQVDMRVETITVYL